MKRQFEFFGKIPAHTVTLPLSGAVVVVPEEFANFNVEADNLDTARAMIADDFYAVEFLREVV